MTGLLIPVTFEGIQTRKDNTIKVILGTQELDPAKAGELFTLNNKFGYCYLSQRTIDQSDIEVVDELDPEFEGKTQSQRLRGVLFLLWKQDDEGYKDFKNYYQAKTDKIIEHLKTKIK